MEVLRGQFRTETAFRLERYPLSQYNATSSRRLLGTASLWRRRPSCRWRGLSTLLLIEVFRQADMGLFPGNSYNIVHNKVESLKVLEMGAVNVQNVIIDKS